VLHSIEFLARFFTAGLIAPAGQQDFLQFALLAAIGLAGAAVLVYARACLALAGVVLGSRPPLREAAPRDVARMLAQSDPDAAGKPRPRAPGVGLPAAV
jgi:hypothetical protein